MFFFNREGIRNMIRETVFLNGGQLKANQCERAIKTGTKARFKHCTSPVPYQQIKWYGKWYGV